MANKDYAIPEAYVFHNGNAIVSDKIRYRSIYMLMFIEKKKAEEPLFYYLDLGVLRDASEKSY